MQFIDLAAQQARIRSSIETRIQKVLDHGKYIMGPEVTELEAWLAGYVGVEHAISCASGTDALLMALMAHGVGPGHAVFTSPFTFIATAEVIRLLGGTPVFVDIEPATFNLDPDHLADEVDRLQERFPGLAAKGIIGVDIFGLPMDYGAVRQVADAQGLFIVEDAAQSFGGEFRGRRAGSLAPIGCTSFFPAKPMGAYGDGGAVFTDDAGLAGVMRSIRVHGQGGHKYDNVRIGINGRLDTLQAAVLLAKAEIFPEEIRSRQEVAARYTDALASRGRVIPPQVPDGVVSAWAQYSVLCADARHRSAVQERLKGEGIPTAIYYPIPLHLQTAFADLGYRKGDFPVSERCAERILSLPMHPYLNPEDQENIIRTILEGPVD